MKIPPWLFTWIVYPLYILWCKTLRFTESGRDKVDKMNDETYETMVFCMWHNEIFPVMYAKRNLRIVSIVSRSADGEYLARILNALGIKTARGSSSRGGQAALREAIDIIEDKKYNACITVDGPRGPRHEPKKGALYLAYYSKAAIVPMRGFSKKAKVFGSWDKFRLPLPFSKVHVAFDEPYYLDTKQKLDDDFLDKACEELKKRLNDMNPPKGF